MHRRLIDVGAEPDLPGERRLADGNGDLAVGGELLLGDEGPQRGQAPIPVDHVCDPALTGDDDQRLDQAQREDGRGESVEPRLTPGHADVDDAEGRTRLVAETEVLDLMVHGVHLC
ncbi:hypothetical protein [Methylobacterium sp. WL30]|uniref:hypothetical protein n=1 Tax=Methylobacterium sp. WL30 TaxID=2603895 RepID=UPI001FF029DA|nr:hypothetical protein [Methylobacterium sp. WL30]